MAGVRLLSALGAPRDTLNPSLACCVPWGLVTGVRAPVLRHVPLLSALPPTPGTNGTRSRLMSPCQATFRSLLHLHRRWRKFGGQSEALRPSRAHAEGGPDLYFLSLE